MNNKQLLGLMMLGSGIIPPKGMLAQKLLPKKELKTITPNSDTVNKVPARNKIIQKCLDEAETKRQRKIDRKALEKSKQSK